jgi:phage tail sheath gpL-like
MAGDSRIIFPDTQIALRGVTPTVGNTAHRVLAVGQMLAAGTAASGELQEEIPNDNSWDTLFGEKSMLAATIRAFKGTSQAPLNRLTRIDAIGLDDAAGTQATGNVTFTVGPAGAAGSITVIVGSQRNNSYTVAFDSADTVTEIGDALVAAITADSKAQVSASNSLGDVTLTANHDGTVGNDIGIKVIGSIADVTIAVTAMSGGATDPSLTTLFDAVAGERYQTILYPANWGFTTLTDFLDARFNTSGELLDGVGYTALVDSVANLKTAANAENSQSLVIYGDKLVDDSLYKGPAILELPYETVGYEGAVRALRLTEGVNISRFVVGNAGLDAFGGVHLSSKPYANTPSPYSPVIDAAKGFSETEINELREAGITVRGNNRAANSIISGPVVTTYKTDAAANPDPAFKFLNYVDTGSAFRELQYNNILASYPQARLSAGDLIPGVPSVNEDELRRFLVQIYVLASTPEFSLTVAGAAAKNYFKEELSVSIDFATGTATVIETVPIVTQFRAFTGTIQIRFDVPL